MVDALERLGGLDGLRAASRSSPPSSSYGYRNKLEYSWSHGRRTARRSASTCAGRWDAAAADRAAACIAARAEQRACARGVRALGARGRARGRTTSASGAGYLRHLVVREGRRTGELLAVLVTAPGRAAGGRTAGRAAGPGGVDRGAARGQRRRGRGHRPACPRAPLLGARPVRASGSSASSCELSAGRVHADQHRDVRRALRPRARARPTCEPDDVVWDLVLRGRLDRPAGGAAAPAGWSASRSRASRWPAPARTPSATGSQRRVPRGRRRQRAAPAARAGRAARRRRSSTRRGPGSRPRPCGA